MPRRLKTKSTPKKGRQLPGTGVNNSRLPTTVSLAPLAQYTALMPDLRFDAAPKHDIMGHGLRIYVRARLSEIRASATTGDDYKIMRQHDNTSPSLTGMYLDPNNQAVFPLWLVNFTRTFQRYGIPSLQLHYRTKASANPVIVDQSQYVFGFVPDGNFAQAVPLTMNSFDSTASQPGSFVTTSWRDADGAVVSCKANNQAGLFYTYAAASATVADYRQEHAGSIIGQSDLKTPSNSTTSNGHLWITMTLDLYGLGFDNGVANPVPGPFLQANRYPVKATKEASNSKEVAGFKDSKGDYLLVNQGDVSPSSPIRTTRDDSAAASAAAVASRVLSVATPAAGTVRKK